jgi:hypothetical protein
MKKKVISDFNIKIKFLGNGVYFWIDKNSNIWDTCKFTEKQADYLSSTLKNCFDCENCENLENCRSCFQIKNKKNYTFNKLLIK